jgi:hypothetical protein
MVNFIQFAWCTIICCGDLLFSTISSCNFFYLLQKYAITWFFFNQSGEVDLILIYKN